MEDETYIALLALSTKNEKPTIHRILFSGIVYSTVSFLEIFSHTLVLFTYFSRFPVHFFLKLKKGPTQFPKTESPVMENSPEQLGINYTFHKL